MNIELWKVIASIGAVMTGPIIWAIRAEAARIRTEMKLLQAELKVDMVEMEKRLNERIDTRLVHR